MTKQDMAVATATQGALMRQAEPAQMVTPMQMLQVAIDRGADIDKLQQLMELHERWESGEARKAFVAAMAAFKADPPEILKTKQVSFRNKAGTLTEYKHATLADVCAAATQSLARVGISHSWDVRQDAGKITVTCILTHERGHRESVAMTATADESGGKNGIQAIASTVSYLERYTLLSASGLATREDDDDDGQAAGVATITAKQAADLLALADEVGLDVARLLAWLKVERVEDLPAAHYQKAIAALESKRAK